MLLINVDSKIPNLALHKIAKFHTERKDNVIWNDDVDKRPGSIMEDLYDKIYVSCVFSWNKHKCAKWEGKAEIGGSGYSLVKDLPPEIEKLRPKINWGFTTRGCIRNCLEGNTLVNTIYGMKPIKELVGKKFGVWTYNQKTGNAYITKATKVWFTGVKECVRVNFDDGTHIICTLDHRFLTFKNGNQSVPTREKVKFAKDLKPKDSVIALRRFEDQKFGVKIHWRRKSILEHRAVMEYIIQRKLMDKEVVHHFDGNRLNNHPRNLNLCGNRSDHFEKHHNKDMSNRMKLNNPMKNPKTVSKMVKTSQLRKPKGSWKRTYEQRLKYRFNKLGKLNPNYKDGKTCGRMSRLDKEVNHKVVSVEYIGKRKVYDMYVPETNWFFANNVLVHNCPWCIVPQKEGKIREVGDVYDIWDGESKSVCIMDNNILALPDTFFKVCEQLKKENLKVDFNQGLDHRLLTDDICKELFSLKYPSGVGGKIRFAFDHISYKKSVLKALKMLRKNGLKDWRTRWYVYVGVEDNLSTVLTRVNLLRKWKQAVFLMRDRDKQVMKNKEYARMYLWTNRIDLFCHIKFEDFWPEDYMTEPLMNGLFDG